MSTLIGVHEGAYPHRRISEPTSTNLNHTYLMKTYCFFLLGALAITYAGCDNKNGPAVAGGQSQSLSDLISRFTKATGESEVEYMIMDDYLTRVLTTLNVTRDSLLKYDMRFSNIKISLNITYAQVKTEGWSTGELPLVPIDIGKSSRRENITLTETQIGINPEALDLYHPNPSKDASDLAKIYSEIKTLQVKIGGMTAKIDTLKIYEENEEGKKKIAQLTDKREELREERNKMRQLAVSAISSQDFADQLKLSILGTALVLENFKNAVSDTSMVLKFAVTAIRTKERTFKLKLTESVGTSFDKLKSQGKVQIIEVAIGRRKMAIPKSTAIAGRD
jgi:hypothetical protein